MPRADQVATDGRRHAAGAKKPTFMFVLRKQQITQAGRGRCNLFAELLDRRLACQSSTRSPGKYDVQIGKTEEPQHLTEVVAGVIVAFDRRARTEITPLARMTVAFLPFSCPTLSTTVTPTRTTWSM